jgi:LuxR family transcriptional regulator, maltose regulon positive regulatory protein
MELRLPPTAVPRPRLERRLDSVPPGGVGTVVASAGSGKSVLLTQWTASRRATPTCRLALTPAHADPAVLGGSLVASIAAAAPTFDQGVGDFISTTGVALGDVFVARLVVALEELEHDIVIVLDDAHGLDGAFAPDLDHFGDRLPGNARVILGARWDPPMNLRSLRLDGRLVEIRAADLAFTADEALPLLRGISGGSIGADQIDALVTRTDGWAVGLQLAAISLQRTPDADRLVRDFTGSDRLVADYLTAEVLRDLEPDLRRFLLRTSVLEVLEPGLCEAVVGEGNAWAMLDLLVQRSLFVTPAEGDPERLRYHHLFGDLLRYQLHYEAPEVETACRTVAASWLLDHGHLSAAIEQFLRIGDTDRVAKIVAEHGRHFVERGESATLVRWLSSARDASRSPSTALLINLLAAQTGAFESGLATETYRQLMRHPDLTAGTQAAASALYSIGGLDDLPTAEVRRATDQSLQSLPDIADDDGDFFGVGRRDSIQTIASFMAGLALLHDGDVVSSDAALTDVLGQPGNQYLIFRLNVLGALAFTKALLGRPSEAAPLATAAFDLAERTQVPHHVALAYAHFAMTQVALDQGRSADATFHLHEGGDLARRTDRVAYLAMHQLLHCERVAAIDGTSRGLEELAAWPVLGLEPAFVRDAARALEVRLRTDQGDLGHARDLIEPKPGGSCWTPLRIDLALAAGEHDVARALLDRWQTPAVDNRAIIERSLRTSILLDLDHSRDAARGAMQEALVRAEREHLRRPFLQSPGALELLQRHQTTSQPFVASILDQARDVDSRATAKATSAELMTDREREILGYLPTRLTNAEIASALFVSVNTLKTHLRHIYAKLEVTDRDTAVERATVIGLL